MPMAPNSATMGMLSLRNQPIYGIGGTIRFSIYLRRLFLTVDMVVRVDSELRRNVVVVVTAGTC